MTVAIYEWQAWDDFLLPTMFPAACRIPARVGESAADVERQVPAETTMFGFHIDLTHTSALPAGRGALVQSLEARGITVVNGLLTDISKRHVQSCCRASGWPTTVAAREGDPDELLIVKTDLNYGGHPERQLGPSDRLFLGLPAAESRRRTSRTYPITARRDVAPEVWERADLLVERFVRNAAGLFFRAHVFLDRMVVTAALFEPPVKELRWGIPRQDFHFDGDLAVPDPPQAYDLSDYCDRRDVAANVPRLRRFCRQIGLDFGAIDIVVDDSGCWDIVDANATPFWNRPDLEEIVQFLAGNRIDCAPGT